MADFFQKIHPEFSETSVAIVSQSFDPNQYPENDHRRIAKANFLLIRYIGDFYGPRSPLPLLLCLQRLQKIAPAVYDILRFELVGNWEIRKENDRVRKLYTCINNIRHIDRVPHSEALKLMYDSDVLLHLDVQTEENYFRPSKLVEYLGSGRPILSFCSPGAGQSFTLKANGIYADVHSVDDMVKALIQLVKVYKKGELDKLRPSEEFRLCFSASNIAQSFDAFVIKEVNYYRLSVGSLKGRMKFD